MVYYKMKFAILTLTLAQFVALILEFFCFFLGGGVGGRKGGGGGASYLVLKLGLLMRARLP